MSSKSITWTGIAFCVGAALFLGCSMSPEPLAGPSEVGNPSSVAALIVDAHGLGAVRIPVRLIDTSYNPLRTGQSDSNSSGRPLFYEDTTTASGAVVFDSVFPGDYNLVGVDSMYRLSLFSKGIVVLPGDTGTQYLDTIRAFDPGRLIIEIPQSTFVSNGAVVVAGTMITYPIDSSGLHILSVPAGAIRFSYYSATGDTTIPALPQDTATVPVDGIVDLSQVPDIITAPCISAGVSMGVAGSYYSFVAGCAASKKQDVLQYRWDWGDSTLSAWQPDTIAGHLWTGSGVYELRVQARNARDTTWASSWSMAIAVTMQ
jgi:hypothetical protein